MRSTRFVLAATAAALVAFAAAGCGGGSGASAGSAVGGGASVAPADTAAFVAVDSDLGSAQWQALDALFAKLPQHDTLLTQLRQRFEQQTKLSWVNDVKPALGPELDVVVLPAASGGKPETVLLTQPTDAAKLDALLAKVQGATPQTAKVDGWTAISESKAALDAVTGATQHLADSSVYQEASGKLAGDALVHAYANGAEAQQLVSALGGSMGAAASGEQLTWAAGDVVAESGGLRVNGFARATGGQTTQPYAAALTQHIPSGALAVADFQAPAATSGTASAKSPLGALAGDLGGETALYVSPGAPLPAVTLVTHSPDPQALLNGIQGALSGLGSSAGGAKAGSLDLGSILGALQLAHATVDGNTVISTSQAAIDAYRGGGQKLADDGSFQEAQSASGMPAQTTGFVYVNLKDALPALQGLAALAGGSAPGGDLSALRTLTAYGSGADGGVERFTAFLEVR